MSVTQTKFDAANGLAKFEPSRRGDEQEAQRSGSDE
jgi:hypothetical protein